MIFGLFARFVDAIQSWEKRGNISALASKKAGPMSCCEKDEK